MCARESYNLLLPHKPSTSKHIKNDIKDWPTQTEASNEERKRATNYSEYKAI